jgi:hypothetical protein
MVAQARRGAHGQYSPSRCPPASLPHTVVALTAPRWGRRPILIARRDAHAGGVPVDTATRHPDEEQPR